MQKRRGIHLTNERLRKRFSSQFDLVNYAITIAENFVATGREINVKTDVQSPAYNILEEIATNREVMAERRKEEPNHVQELRGHMSREDVLKAVESRREVAEA